MKLFLLLILFLLNNRGENLYYHRTNYSKQIINNTQSKLIIKAKYTTNKDYYILYWKSKHNIKVDYYILQKSLNNEKFTTLVKIANTKIEKYHYKDNIDKSLYTNYRLIIIDNNGNASFSNTIRILNKPR